MHSLKPVELVSAIHKRVREQAASYRAPELAEDWSNDLAKLHAAYNAAYCARNLVGSTPSLPNTLLGILAGRVISIAQRILFWYTPQIRYFNEAIITVLNRLCALEERRFQAFLAMSERLEDLHRDVRLLKTAPASRDAEPAADSAPPSGESYTRSAIDVKDFYFELQGRFQSSEPADLSRLKLYSAMIENLDPRAPEGPWLDIGCGRGGWLEVVRNDGKEAHGLDSNPAAIRECRRAGFEVTQSDALHFLRSAADRSFAVITAFHFMEHCPFEYCLNLVYQAGRTLKPGGVFLIETPHPGNLLMAAEQFWLDPTHQRPIPISLMEYLFEYCGIGVVRRLEINPRAESEHLPLLEFELAARLDRLLYGPQDYAVLGRRDPL